MYGALCGLVTNAETAPKVANLVPQIVQVSHVCDSYALMPSVQLNDSPSNASAHASVNSECILPQHLPDVSTSSCTECVGHCYIALYHTGEK